MTLVARNSLLRVGLILVFTLLLGFIAALVFIYTRGTESALSDFDEGVNWLGLTWRSSPHHLYWLLSALLVQGLLSFVALGAMLRMFRKTTAPEVFFFSVFVFSLALDMVKAGQLVIVILHYSPVYGAMLTRVVHFGHFFGIFCLLSSSLYLSGLEYQKTGIVLGIVTLLSLTLAYNVPVDFSRLFPSLMHPVGDQTTMQVVALILGTLVLINVLYALAAVQERALLVLLLALVLIISAREAVLYVSRPIVYAVGIPFLIVGVGLFVWRIRKMYLWR
ncbi:MAG: hypothetical protein ACQETQ_05830 [Spirochaetota bacterium]